MAWCLLVIAGLFEVGWAVGLRFTDGFSRFWPSVLTAVSIVASMYLLAVAARTLPIGTAYAVWVGIGAAGTAVIGMLVLHEPVSAWRIFFLTLLGVAIIGLKITSASHG